MRGLIAGAVLFAAFMLGMVGASRADWSISAMNQQIEQTNFLVNDGCSGTLIDVQERLILTNNHCVTNQYETIERERVSEDGVVTKEKVRRLRDGRVAQLQFSGSESTVTVSYRVRLRAVDKDRDLALMQIIAQVPNTDAAKLSCAEPIRGESVYIVGNPMGALYSSVTKGIVSSVQRNYDLLKIGEQERAKQPLMQVSGGLIGGNSGGAVYSEAGELIGVPVMANQINEVIGFAVPLDAVKAFLKEHKLERLYAGCGG